jgi:aryl-alcohol dehydrogenase-like predicted oxidoreductase
MKILVLGSWQNLHASADQSALASVWAKAIDQGIRHFDTADSYEDGIAEILLADLLQGLPRASYQLSSKCFFATSAAPLGGLSVAHVKPALEGTLKRLQTDYLDVYFAHRDDQSLSVEQIAETFNECIAEGSIRHWGICRWAPERVAALMDFCQQTGLQPPVAQQFHYHLFNRDAEQESFPLYSRFGLPTWVYSPLAQGVLTGKYHDGIPNLARAGMEHAKASMWEFHPEKIARVRAWAEWLQHRGLTPVQAAMAFCLSRPEVSHVLIGATQVQQLEEILSAANVDWQQEIVEVFDAMSTYH